MAPDILTTILGERAARWLSFGQGSRSGLIRGTCIAGIVLMVNLILAIYSSRHSVRLPNGRRILYEGDCEMVKDLDTGLHLVINVLSTLLLSACNYAMQVLSAPTRDEVDSAHKERVWLDIGILSFKNLRRIDPRRKNLWILFLLSSLPLHLFYNSTIYSTLYTADYLIVMTTEDMLSSNASSHSLGINPSDPKSFYANTATVSLISNDTLRSLSSDLYTAAVANNLTRLDTLECINNYATPFPKSQGNLILVTSDATKTPYVTAYDTMDPLDNVYAGCPARAYDWICNQEFKPGYCTTNPTCSQLISKIDPSDWRPFGNKIDYCLSQTIKEKCNLALNEPIIGVVLVFNLVKCILLVWTIFLVGKRPTNLLTIGDSIASFLRRSDDTTKDLCLMSRDDLTEWKKSLSKPKTMIASRRRWHSVVSKSRWICLVGLYSILLIICFVLFIYGIQPRTTSTSALMEIAFGAPDPNTMIEGSGWAVPAFGNSGLLSNIFVANSPQILLSMIYFAYNSLFTSFMLGLEWNTFASVRKGLRVSSNPIGEQRGTHFLQLPFRWAIPLMTLGSVLHWLCSQSIFLVSAEFDHFLFQSSNGESCHNPDGNVSGTSEMCQVQYFTCGYTPKAILCTILLGVLMIVFALLMGLRRYRNVGMPVAGSCSAAISASCHLKTGTGDEKIDQEEKRDRISHAELQWGEFDSMLISEDVDSDQGDAIYRDSSPSQRRIYHCGFSNQEVNVPEKGKLYAGLP